MSEKVYILYSDSTWSSISVKGKLTSLEDRINANIKNHYWPFPLDIKGDSRREVIVIKNANNIIYMKGV